jgi:chitodextrinase
MKVKLAAVMAIVAGAAACTVHKQESPDLTGPSELGTAITVQVSPDVLAQDGASQSIVTIIARDANGQPIRNLPLRAEITVNGVITDFGSLSARNVVTDANGRASLVYTAPPAPAVSVDNGTMVAIQVVPTGTDFGNAVARLASIRLVPPNVVTPPDNLRPDFVFSPGAPAEGASVLFDASTSASASQNPIASYTWNFGDGDTATGRTVNHTFDNAGNYTVRLTITDSVGRTGSVSKQVSVSGAAKPTADFVFSPNPAQLRQPVHFNASGSTPPAGRRIISYNWDFGDGQQVSVPAALVDHVFQLARTYVVTLTVTDDQGHTSLPKSASITPQ